MKEIKIKRNIIKFLMTITVSAVCFIYADGTVFASGETIDLSYENGVYYTFEDENSLTNDELFEEYANSLFYEGVNEEEYWIGAENDFVSTKPSGLVTEVGASSYLNHDEQISYGELKKYAGKIAKGELTYAIVEIPIVKNGTYVLPYNKKQWTYAELGISASTSFDTKRQTVMTAAMNAYGFNDRKLMDALLKDCPYEMYWFDKQSGVAADSIADGIIYDDAAGTIALRNFSVKYLMSVSTDFADTGEETVVAYWINKSTEQVGLYSFYFDLDPTKTNAASKVVANAKLVVENNKNLNDFDKMIAYRDYICDAVSTTVNSSLSTKAYGNPWQLINVFDDNSSTNVGYEGYAKAFKYLCDLSDFDGDVHCYLMSGIKSYNGEECGHMWNIVHMNDGLNYLADIQYSDVSSVSYENGVFFNGYAQYASDTKHSSDGCESKCYVFNTTDGKQIKYYAFNSDRTMFGNEVIDLSDECYFDAHNIVDGKCTRCAYCGDGVGAKIAGYKLSLSGDVTVNFYMTFTRTTLSDSGNYVEFTINDRKEKYLISETDKVRMNNRDCYIFPCRLNAKEMCYMIYAQVYSSSGEAIGTQYSFSVREYADAIINGNYTNKEKNIAKALLLYGQSAKEYFEIDSEISLAEGITLGTDSASKTIISATNTLAVTSTGNKVVFSGSRLELTNNVSLKVYFRITDGSDIEDYTFKVGTEIKQPQKSGEYYVVTLDNIKASELGKLKTITIQNEARTTVGTVKICPMSYVREAVKNDSEGYASYINVCKSLYVLWKNCQ